MAKMEEFVGTAKAAEMLGRDEISLRRWRSQGTGPPYRNFNGRILYLPKEVEEWKNRQLNTPITGKKKRQKKSG